MKNGKLTLASGRTIWLDSLRQWHVYSGLLEGLPTREMNDEQVEHMRADARERTGHEPHLIAPVQTAIAYEGRYPFGEPARLPPIACEAAFESAGKDPLHFAQLTVIWFQDDYAFPLSPEAEAAIVSLDWDRLADEQER